MKLTHILFAVLYVSSLLLSVFTLLAPRPLLEQSYVHLWGWLVMLVPAWWFAKFVRTLYRGGE